MTKKIPPGAYVGHPFSLDAVGDTSKITPFSYEVGKLYQSTHHSPFGCAIHQGDDIVKVYPKEIIMYLGTEEMDHSYRLFLFLAPCGTRICWINACPLGKMPHLYFKEVTVL